MTTATEVGYVEMRIAKVVGLATAEEVDGPPGTRSVDARPSDALNRV